MPTNSAVVPIRCRCCRARDKGWPVRSNCGPKLRFCRAPLAPSWWRVVHPSLGKEDDASSVRRSADIRHRGRTRWIGHGSSCASGLPTAFAASSRCCWGRGMLTRGSWGQSRSPWAIPGPGYRPSTLCFWAASGGRLAERSATWRRRRSGCATTCQQKRPTRMSTIDSSHPRSGCRRANRRV